ncbi:LysR substrate-binding domain-containing protein [Roseiterribacter gracilis]|uniref:LysR family transcriptional regulator n=1 Tax=Roseiterribacter gracilis TaxID=2812848 RepID=A0A8S8X678_9PROT|nr:LysR family transcriptional regulator [Rhodospirillales bacterium TMPK1]
MDRTGPTVDLSVLRTLVAAVDLGGFGRAASLLDRSPSAVSLQLRGLEAQLGQRLFRKDGRGVALTETGDVIVSYARRMLELNDEMLTAVRSHAVEGELRFGLPHDLAQGALPATLARYARAHPGVRVQVRVAGNRAVLDLMERGELDVALVFARADPNEKRAGSDVLATLPMIWIGGPTAQIDDPLSLVLLDPPCIFRQAATAALDAAGKPWRVVASSDSVTGLYATVEAGLGITVRTQMGLPPNLRLLSDGLPALPSVDLCLRHAPGVPSAAATRLAELLRVSVAEQLKLADTDIGARTARARSVQARP